MQLPRTMDVFLIFKGPGYRLDAIFDLSTMQPYTLNDLLEAFQSLASDVALYLPRTSDLRQIADRTNSKRTTVVHYCMEGASKVRYGVSNHKFLDLT